MIQIYCGRGSWKECWCRDRRTETSETGDSFSVRRTIHLFSSFSVKRLVDPNHLFFSKILPNLSIKQSDTRAKRSMRIEHVNATFDAKVHNNGLRISHQPNGSKTCHIFVYSEDGKTIVDWYTAIRAAKFCSRKVAFPAQSELELATALTRDFLLEGYLFKTGPRIGDAYRRRYFILDDRNLMYSDDPLVSLNISCSLHDSWILRLSGCWA